MTVGLKLSLVKKNDALLFPEKVIFIHQNILQGYQKDVLHLKSQDFEHFNENKISIYQLWTMKQQIIKYLHWYIVFIPQC
jgi:hypothetical protein